MESKHSVGSSHFRPAGGFAAGVATPGPAAYDTIHAAQSTKKRMPARDPRDPHAAAGSGALFSSIGFCGGLLDFGRSLGLAHFGGQATSSATFSLANPLGRT